MTTTHSSEIRRRRSSTGDKRHTSSCTVDRPLFDRPCLSSNKVHSPVHYILFLIFLGKNKSMRRSRAPHLTHFGRTRLHIDFTRRDIEEGSLRSLPGFGQRGVQRTRLRPPYHPEGIQHGDKQIHTPKPPHWQRGRGDLKSYQRKTEPVKRSSEERRGGALLK